MSKVIIHAPHMDTVIIDDISAFITTNLGTTLYSGIEPNEYVKGFVPLNALVEWVK